jgi:hypothetical protein
MLQSLLGDDPGLAPLTQRLIERTQGNPFFLEESVRTLRETQVLVGEPGVYRLAMALLSIQVPAAVQAVLAARIDRLPPEEKQLLQTAAVIGTEVPLALLQAIADVPEEALRLGLAHLQAAEFLYETRLFPDIEYTFKHALTQQVAYETLLQEWRRALHARIVAALEALAGDQVAEQVERLAYHALRGEVWTKALAYGRQAGEKAMARSAHREAVGYFEQALGALPHVPEQRHTREQAIDLRIALRSALWPSGDLGRILAYLREAETLAAALDDPRRLAQVLPFLSEQFRFMGAMTRPLPLASAPSPLLPPVGRWSGKRRRTSASASPTRPRATIVAPSTASGRAWQDSTGRSAASTLVRSSCPPCSPVPTSPGAMPSWVRSLRAGPSGKKGSGLLRKLRTLGASCMPITGSVCWPSAKATCPGHSPGSNGLWASVRTRTSRSFSSGSRRPWARHTPWPGAAPTPCRCSRRR